MRRFLTIFWIIGASALSAQDSFYNSISLGKYGIGYTDTLLFNSALNYDQFGYSGDTPLFVQIWHPIKANPSDIRLTYGDFKSSKVPENLRSVYSLLNQQMNESFINYNLSESFPDYEEIDYGSSSKAEVLEKVKSIPTKSVRARLTKKTNYPVIIYHHGLQGLATENYFMAEYFASRGYIFVASNFHLPHAGSPYGLQEGIRDNTTSVKTVISFAKTLSSNESIFYVGHSWGAQVGWTFLHNPEWSKGFVSMETTIEFKKDTMEIMEKWPFVYKSLKTDKNQLNIPVLLFANTGEEKPFWFFENASSKKMYHATNKVEFAHESYTSSYFLRYFLKDFYPQPDTVAMKEQLTLYAEHLRLIEAFFNAIQTSKSIDRNDFQEHFLLSTKN